MVGGTGFVGRQLAALWGAQRPASCLRFLLHRSQPEWIGASGHELRHVDLTDRASLTAAVDGCATLINLLRPNGDGWLDDAMAKLLPAIEGRVSGVVHASSIDVYGAAPEPFVTEATEPQPVSAYANEHYNVERRLAGSTTPSVILRLGAVFGAGGRNLLSMAEQVAREPVWKLAARRALNGKRRFHLIAVESVAEAVSMFARTPPAARTERVLVTEDVEEDNNFAFVQQRFANAFGRSVPATGTVPSFALQYALMLSGRDRASPYRRFSNAKLERLGFKPSVAFRDRIDRYAAHLAAEHERRTQ